MNDREIISALRSLLREICWSTADRSVFDRQGYSIFVNEETAIRDVNYRNVTLYATADEAIDAALTEIQS